MKKLSERLEKIMLDNNLNKKTLAELTGFSDVMVGKYIKDKSLPGFDFLQAVVTKIPNINSHWLLTGYGPQYNSGDSRLKVLNDYAPIEVVANIEEREEEFKEEKAFLRMTNRIAKEHGLIGELIKDVEKLRTQFNESQRKD